MLLLSVSTLQHSLLCIRAQSYAERLRLGLAVLHGEANTFDSEMVDGPQSPPLQRPTAAHTGLELPCKNTALSWSWSTVKTHVFFHWWWYFIFVNGVNVKDNC